MGAFLVLRVMLLAELGEVGDSLPVATHGGSEEALEPG